MKVKEALAWVDEVKPRRHKLHIPRSPAGGRARSLRCASSPDETHCVGLPSGNGLRAGTRWERRIT